MWRIEFDGRAYKDLARLGKSDQKRVREFLDSRIVGEGDPRRLGSALTGRFKGIWRYRVGDIRILTKIEDEICVVLVIEVTHRREVYR